jgi:hypothetical protein
LALRAAPAKKQIPRRDVTCATAKAKQVEGSTGWKIEIRWERLSVHFHLAEQRTAESSKAARRRNRR